MFYSSTKLNTIFDAYLGEEMDLVTGMMPWRLFIVFGFFPRYSALPVTSAHQIGNTIWESLLHAVAADTPLLY